MAMALNENFAQILCSLVNDCKENWNTLRRYFAKLLGKPRSDSGADVAPQWKFYEAMSFLLDQIALRKYGLVRFSLNS